MKFYNTLAGKKEKFKPLKKKFAGLYTCGPTVYDYAHLGNLRTYIFEDVLKRALILNGYRIKHVMNITDVGHLTSDADEGEDKMTKALRREEKPLTMEAMKELAYFYAEKFKKDIAELNILPPDIWCFASEHVKAQINLIKRLENNDYAYSTNDGVYFNVVKFKDYGKLARLRRLDNKSRTRVINPEKKNPRDFALWKFNEKLGWESPWGKGFPGWHIECSAMAMEYLGESFDIHCGGIDHIPVHHTNEIAQAEAATGKKFVNYWLHGNFLTLKGARMGKSKGNFLNLAEIKKKGFHPLDFRYLALTAHYRSPLLFSLEALKAAKIARQRLNNLFEFSFKLLKNQNSKFREAFFNAVNDDLNTPRALAVLWKNINSLNSRDFLWADRILGLGFDKIKKIGIPAEIAALAEKREKFRREKKWKEADKLRKELASLGWLTEDTPTGSRLIRKI
ncbi:MAG: cysteine--tRNA ligase [Candidatus Niyogibacteria bacterium]|nr:cysteine--tRNA ligase [Candidatus Niyogibacteria bacterium]